MCMMNKAGWKAAALLLAVLLACMPAMALAGYASRKTEIAQEELNVPPVFEGKTYQLYHSGPTIKLIKERLQKLGYFQPRTGFGDKFDEKLRSRVIEFQRSNGLEETGCVDRPTAAALYSENPVRGFWYTGEDAEPERALIIPVTRSMHWYTSAEDQIGVRIALRNISSKKTAEAFEISMYTEDAQGKRLHETERIVKICSLEPYAEMWSDYAYFNGVKDVHAVYVALHRVRYADGTYEIYDDAPYLRWELEK